MEAVQYEVVDFGKFFLRRNEYMGMQGYPTDETDALWTDLYDRKYAWTSHVQQLLISLLRAKSYTLKLI